MAASNRVVRSPFRDPSGFPFPDYTQEVIDSTSGRCFTEQRCVKIEDTERTMYFVGKS